MKDINLEHALRLMDEATTRPDEITAYAQVSIAKSLHRIAEAQDLRRWNLLHHGCSEALRAAGPLGLRAKGLNGEDISLTDLLRDILHPRPSHLQSATALGDGEE